MVAWLLDHGADPNQQSAIDLTPLSIAVEDAPISVIKLMLNRGGDTQKGQLLHHAIDRNSDETTVLKLIIESGADINSIMYENHEASRAMYCFMSFGTALHKAVELRKVEVVRFLISEGASLDIKDTNGLTPLEFAQTLKQQEIIQALEKGN